MKRKRLTFVLMLVIVLVTGLIVMNVNQRLNNELTLTDDLVEDIALEAEGFRVEFSQLGLRYLPKRGEEVFDDWSSNLMRNTV